MPCVRMPSAAASVKLEKQASGNQTESTDNNNANSPIRQALVIIEHKIRNLEKRKTKLESYRTIQSSGKELSPDQKAAVSKYDEVAQSLEFARELSKQMQQLATVSEKEQKKQARKDLILRAQAETNKIREVLTIQNILWNFSNNEQVREDFLNGSNGAAKLEEEDVTVLEKFYVDIQVKRQTTPEDVPFYTGAQKAAEYLSFTIDGRPKQYGETTFDNVRRILNIVQECGYLDKGGDVVETTDTTTIIVADEDSAEDGMENDQDDVENDATTEKTETIIAAQENVETAKDADIVNANIPQQVQPQSQQSQLIPPVSVISQKIDVPTFVTPSAPSAAAVPAPSFPQQPHQHSQQQPQPTLVNTQQIPSSQPPPHIPIPVVPTQIIAAASVAQAQVIQGPPTVVAAAANPALHAGHFPATTVRAVEQAYFKQHQYIQQMRPLAEVIGAGNFFFLQDSELDSPDLIPFTPNDGQQNQNQNMATAGNISTPGSNTTGGLPNQTTVTQQQTPTQQQQQSQQQQQQQQQPQLPVMSQQQKSSQQQTPMAPTTTPISTQTFTNQSFPPIVPPPSAIYPPQAVQNPNEISSSQPQMPTVFAAGPLLPIAQMVASSAVAQQSPVVVSAAAPSTTGGGPTQISGVVLKSVETQQQSGIVIANQPALITGPSGASVPLPGFTNAVVSSKFPSAPTPPIVGVIHQTSQKPHQQQQGNYEKLQKTTQQGKILNENQIHKKVDEVVKERLDRSNENTNEWNSKSSKKDDESSNQWSSEVKNEWSNSSYDNQVASESNNWSSSSNQTDNGGGYNNRSRNNNFGSGSHRPGGGNRGMRGPGSNNGGGGGPGGGGPPPSNGYRGGRSSNTYQQQQNNRSSSMFFRNSNDNSGGGGGGGGGGYYQNQNGGGGGGGSGSGYNTSGGGNGGGGKQDGNNGNYGGNINTGYRPRGGPMPSSNRQQQSGGGSRSVGGNSAPPTGSGGPLPQRNRPNVGGMANPNRPAGGGGGGGDRNTGGARTTAGTYGSSRPPNVRQQHQQQQDVNA